MGATTNGKRTDECGSAAAHGSQSEKVASRGIRTTGDLIDLGIATISDALTGALGSKEGGLVIRGGNFVLRTAEFQFRHAGGKDIELVHDKPDAESPREVEKRLLKKRLAELEQGELAA